MDPRINKSVTPNLPFPNPSGNVTGNTQYVYNFIHPHPAAAFFSQPPFLQNMTMISPQQFPPANFSGGNENGDLAEISQPTVLPKKKFTSAEDDALISAFIKVSTDAAAAAAAGAANQNHRKEALWGKVKAVYDEAREANAAEIRERSTGMLNNRFRRISSGVLKFVSCYDEASRQRGLMNEEEVLKYARDLFGGYFHFENCWILLKTYPKYREVVAAYGGNKSQPQDDFRRSSPTPTDESCADTDGGSCKRTRLNEGGFSTDFGGGERGSEGDEIVKEEKSKGKVRVEMLGQLSKSVTNIANNVIDPKYYWEKLDFLKSKEAARRAQKQAELDLQKQKMEMESRNTKMQLLHSLLQKENLDERMENLKNGLLKELGF